MSWIDLPADDETPELDRLTRPYRGEGQNLPGIVAALKPNPKGLRTVLQMNYAVTFGGSTLGRRLEELIASAVSALNHCYY